MKTFKADAIRNVAILGHTGVGKTTMTESMLHLAGVTTRFGTVSEGTTISDHDPEEIKRKNSISSSIIPIEWKHGKINFIDTPGFFDFYGETYQALKVANLALIVVNAKSGIEVGTEKAWELATKAGLPKMIFINHMDDENVDFKQLIADMKEKFGKCIAPTQLPIYEGEKFTGYVNVIKKEGRKYRDTGVETCQIPESLEEETERLNHMLQEAVAETDDALMEKFFAEEEFTRDEIYRGLEKGITAGTTTPVFLGCATLSCGIGVLMDNIKDFCPPASQFGDTIEDEALNYDAGGPFAAYVFKTVADNFGKLSIFKVMSGTLTKDTPIYNANKEQVEKNGGIFIIRGKEQIAVNELKAGDIGAIAKLAHTNTCDTLSTKEAPFMLPAIDFPKPFYAQGIVPKNKGDEDKVLQGLLRFLEEDKTLSFKVDAETKQTVLAGLGDSHLDVIVNKMKNRNKIELELTPLVVAFRETIRGKADVQGRHKKQSGGAGQFGDVKMRFEP
ncbi:MAG: elongation factor G, partial [Defluviitaleaceae bacterium]|nr:elongation factor G [Defluviitaleaceae bacterium]